MDWVWRRLHLSILGVEIGIVLIFLKVALTESPVPPIFSREVSARIDADREAPQALRTC